MSAPGGGFLRLRLFFDYPPPSTPESCQCWLLLDLSRCRVVTDLSSLIRSKFGFSHGARLSLYLQDCLLPPCEGIGLVRDNDAIRVKLEEVSTLRDVDEDGYNVIHSPSKANKRLMVESENEEDPPQMKKKKKHQLEMSPSDELHYKAKKVKIKSKQGKIKPGTTQDTIPEVKGSGIDEKKKPKKKRERNKEIEFENIAINSITITKRNKALDASVISEKASPSKGQLEKSKKIRKVSKSDSSNTSSLSSDEEKSKQSAKKSPVSLKNKTEIAASDTTVENALAPVAGFDTKLVSKKGVESTSNSDSDSSKEGTCKTVDNPLSETKTDCAQNNSPSQPIEKNVPPASESSDSSDSDSFVIRKPKPGYLTGGNQITLGNGDNKSFEVLYGPAPNPKWAERGMGRGFGRGENVLPWRGPRGRGFRWRGRGRGRGREDNTHVTFDYSSASQKQQQLNHTVSNRSIIIQNPPENPRDYSTLPLLAAPPQVGQKIAFKLLELTDSYTPEVSQYKEGKIISYCPARQQLDLEVYSASQVAKGPGKFDLVYEGAGGKHTVEYAISQDSKISQSWSTLIEPRLIVETCSIPAISGNKENGENVSLTQ